MRSDGNAATGNAWPESQVFPASTLHFMALSILRYSVQVDREGRFQHTSGSRNRAKNIYFEYLIITKVHVPCGLSLQPN